MVGADAMRTATRPHRPPARPPKQEGFLRRHFWPHGPVGVMALTVVVAVACGLVAAVIYTNRDAQQFRSTRDAELERKRLEADRIAAEAAEEERIRNLPPPLPSPEALAKKTGPSVWAVETLDVLGRPVAVTAFVVGAVGRQSVLITSLDAVRALTREPGPGVVVRNGDETLNAVLWGWQDEWDLAALVVDRSLAQVEWAQPGAGAGDHVYVVGGDGAITPADLVAGGVSSLVAGLSPTGHQVGGMLISAKGEVLGMVSRALSARLGGGDAAFVVPVQAACERVLVCGPTYAPAPDAVPIAPTTTTTVPPAPVAN